MFGKWKTGNKHALGVVREAMQNRRVQTAEVLENLDANCREQQRTEIKKKLKTRMPVFVLF
jgi:hypothetical protein